MLQSIRFKLALLICVSSAIAMLLISIANFAYAVYSNKIESLENLSVLATVTSANLIAPLEFEDQENTLLVLQTFKPTTNILGAFVVDHSSAKMVATYIRPKQKGDNLLATIRQMHQANGEDSLIQYIDFDKIIVNHPIISDSDRLGTLFIVESTQGIKQRMVEIMKIQLAIALFFTLLAFLASFFLQRIFTTPIITLQEKIEDITNTQSYNTVHLERRQQDEFKALYDGFNTMIALIDKQSTEAKEAHATIDTMLQHINASIDYSAIIQSSILPDNADLRAYFANFFVIWHPKDRVGGDIYLINTFNEDECLIMAIDCTGHGVPGAFVTMLVKAIERQLIASIASTKEEISPGKILGIFNRSMRHLLKQDRAESLCNAGFDGGFLYYNKKRKIVKYAGAECPLFYTKENKVVMIKGSRQSVGYKKSKPDFVFKEHCIEVSEGMCFYLTTDGFLDQNGGEKGFCFGKRRFQQLITEYHEESMPDQQELFLYEMLNYQGDYERNDDMTVIGLQI